MKQRYLFLPTFNRSLRTNFKSQAMIKNKLKIEESFRSYELMLCEMSKLSTQLVI